MIRHSRVHRYSIDGSISQYMLRTRGRFDSENDITAQDAVFEFINDHLAPEWDYDVIASFVI